MKKHAFTLAEALITLVIVGVIAAVTVPALANRYAQIVNSERHANIVYKMATAMHNMKIVSEKLIGNEKILSYIKNGEIFSQKSTFYAGFRLYTQRKLFHTILQ